MAAQTEETSDRELSLTEVRSLRHQVESSSAPEEGQQKQLLELYDRAIADLESANQAQVQIQRHEHERTRIQSRVAALRIELGRLQDRVDSSLPDDLNAERLETALAREQSLLGSLRVALRDIQELAAERLRRRNEVAQRLGTLDQEIESVNAELREASELIGSDELRQAARTCALARRAALVVGSEELRAELRLVEERAVLLPWQRDVAELKVARSERVTAMLEVVLRDLRRREAGRSLQEVRARTEEISEELPELAEMTEEVARLAEMLWAADGVVAQSLLADSALTDTRKKTTQLESIVALTKRRFEAIGHTGDLTQWWPTIPAGFPRIAELEAEIQQREALIPEVQHQLIQYEQQRAQFREYESEIDRLLDESEQTASGGIPPQLRTRVWDLVHTGRELLDRLVEEYGRFAGRLVELVTLSHNFLAEGEALRGFTQERVLWARSVPGSIFPNPENSLRALLWIASPGNWSAGLSQVGRAILGSALGAILFVLTLGLLIWSRPRVASRLEVLAGRVADTGTDSFLASLEALGHTVLLAAPIPLLLNVGGRVLQSSSICSCHRGAGTFPVRSLSTPPLENGHPPAHRPLRTAPDQPQPVVPGRPGGFRVLRDRNAAGLPDAAHGLAGSRDPASGRTPVPRPGREQSTLCCPVCVSGCHRRIQTRLPSLTRRQPRERPHGPGTDTSPVAFCSRRAGWIWAVQHLVPGGAHAPDSQASPDLARHCAPGRSGQPGLTGGSHPYGEGRR